MAAQYSPLRGRTSSEEVARLAVHEPESPREAGILRTGTDVDALRRIQAMPLHEEDAEPGQRLPTPAGRRSRRVRTIFDLDVDTQLIAHPPHHSGNPLRRLFAVRDLRLPGDAEELIALFPVSAKHGRPIGHRFYIIRRQRHAKAQAAAKQHILTADDHGPIDE
jgi:hypothetical protein